MPPEALSITSVNRFKTKIYSDYFYSFHEFSQTDQGNFVLQIVFLCMDIVVKLLTV